MTEACQDYINSLNSAVVLTLSVSLFHVVFSVIAVGANITILAAIWRTPSLHTPSIFFLSGLALADLGVGLVVQPAFAVLHILISTKHFDVCSLMTFYNLASSFLSGISLTTVTAVSLDRYLALHLNLRYQEIVTKTRAKAALIVIWISTGFLTCIWLKSFEAFLTVASALLSICTLVTCFAYLNIYRFVRHHKAQIQVQMNGQQNLAEHIKTAVQTFIIFIAFSLCHCPYLCVMITVQLIEPNSNHWLALDCSVSLLLINSNLNPVLYCWRNKNIRNSVKKLLRVLCKCCTTDEAHVQ